VLALGRVDRRRHVAELAAACALLRRRGLAVRLVLAGRRGDAAGELDGAPASEVELRTPREAELPLLVARAGALAHLSDGELTAVTPLEALACGAGVVASRLPAVEEALGGHARFVDHAPGQPVPVEPLAEALAQALAASADPRARAARRAHAADSTWARHAALTLALWQRILSR
jgi:glycosyltransferase involved in cell wall biosynthesis